MGSSLENQTNFHKGAFALRKAILLLLASSLTSSLALADVTYEEETKTGGMMKLMMGHATKSTTRVSGDFMRTDHDDNASIVDLKGERIITLDSKKKTYSVMTFAEMKKKMEEAMATMKSKQAEASKESKKQGSDVSVGADVKVTDTGRKETIQGMDCKQYLMEMGMTVSSAKEQQSGRMSTLTEMWLAKDVPGQAEVQAFYRKMGQKLGTMSLGTQFLQGGQKGAQQPGMTMDVQKMADEMKKMDGHSMRSVVYIGDPEAAKKEAMGEKPEGGGAGGGGGFGGLGGMLKKMKPGQSGGNDESASKEGGQPSQSPGGVMMKITTETTNIDTKPIAPGVFQIPSDYKEIPSR
jgi:hypothetical protein